MIFSSFLSKGVISSVWRRQVDMPPSRQTPAALLVPAQSSPCPLVGTEVFLYLCKHHELLGLGESRSQTAAGGCRVNAPLSPFQECSVLQDSLGWDVQRLLHKAVPKGSKYLNIHRTQVWCPGLHPSSQVHSYSHDSALLPCTEQCLI